LFRCFYNLGAKLPLPIGFEAVFIVKFESEIGVAEGCFRLTGGLSLKM